MRLNMKGFTLAEALVSMLILSFLAAGTLAVLNVGNMSYSTDLGLLDLQQQARLVIDGMIRELRQTRDSDITVVSSSEINFNIPSETYGDPWIGPIEYYWDSTNNRIIREFPSGTQQIIANEVTALSFNLVDKLLNIQFTCQKTVRGRDLSFSLAGQARFRNE